MIRNEVCHSAGYDDEVCEVQLCQRKFATLNPALAHGFHEGTTTKCVKCNCVNISLQPSTLRWCKGSTKSEHELCALCCHKGCMGDNRCTFFVFSSPLLCKLLKNKFRVTAESLNITDDVSIGDDFCSHGLC